jgi:uncharacterized protein (DUF885 family)
MTHVPGAPPATLAGRAEGNIAMKTVGKWLLRGVLLLLLVGVIVGVNFWYFKPWQIGWFYNRVFLQFALDDPEMLSGMRLLEQIGIQGHNRKLSDASPAHDDAQFEKLKRDYATFKSYDRTRMQGQDALSYDILDQFMKRQIDGERFRFHDFPVNQMYGVQSSLPNFMANTHQVTNAKEARYYIERLEKFGVKFDQTIESLKLRESKGILPPKFTVEKVLEQMRGFAGKPVRENPLYTTFAEKLDKIPATELDALAREKLLVEVEGAIEKTVYPAYARLIAYFVELQPKAQSNDGAWRLPDGDAFYAQQVKMHTTTEMTPEQVHALGLAEVERIGAEMDQILRDAGYTEGTLGERIDKLGKAPEQLFSDDADGRKAILAEYQHIIDEVTAGLDPYFATKAKAKVEVRRVPEFAEKTAPGAYYEQGAMDGTRPGVFYANLRSVAEIPKFGMRTLAYHEAVPGHHFQISIAQELKGLPMFRQFIPFTAYVEGWALYAERLAWEAGFEKNPLDNLGRLQAEMFRAVRLVVDTGMHAKHWSREQAIAYMLEHTGMGEKETEAEIERYLVIPGQALAYKVGMLKILELRERAREKLGAKFDIKEFHDVVLKSGAMPLTLLERTVDEWIASR